MGLILYTCYMARRAVVGLLLKHPQALRSFYSLQKKFLNSKLLVILVSLLLLLHRGFFTNETYDELDVLQMYLV